MKSVLRSAKPYWIYLILTEKKTIEVGKDFPKSADWNKIVEMYCSKDMRSFNRIPEKDREWMRKYLGKVACRFVCNSIEDVNAQCSDSGIDLFYHDCAKYGCLSQVEVEKYFGVYDEERTKDLRDMKGNGYAWHISDLKIYDKPKELEEFKYPCQRGYNDINNAWCYRERGARLTMCKYNDMKNNCCNAYLTRPPQSWCYVEKL